MKKVVSLFLVLVMVFAAVSALALPSNISEIQGLPELPELPTMKVKTKGDTTVTMSAPVASMDVLRNWQPTALEFDENNVAVYSTAGQKVSAGFGVWGWTGAGSRSADTYGWDMDGTDLGIEEYEYKDEYKESDYGAHYYGYKKVEEHEANDEHPDGYTTITYYDSHVHGGSYAMSYAYRGVTTDGITVMYDTHGKLVMAVMELTGQNFLGSEIAPSKSIITWTFGSTSNGKPITYISRIEELVGENAVVSADFASNGKRIR